jgi:uncharacterized membrane protein
VGLAEGLESALWQFGYVFCHQIPERSFFIDGHQFPICARCTGIFLGFIVTSVYILMMGGAKRPLMPDRTVLAFAAAGSAAMVFDGVTSYAGLRDTTNVIRLATGLGMGAAIGFLLPVVLRVVALGGELPVGGRPVATWIDVPAVYGLLFAAGAAVYSASTGLWILYLAGGVAIAGFLVLIHLALRMLASSVLAARFTRLAPPRIQLATALALQAALMGALWAGHRWVDLARGVA